MNQHQSKSAGSGGWWRRVGSMFVQATRDFFHDNGPQWAAAISYYGLLSIFPLLLAAAAVAAFFVEPAWVVGQLTSLLGQFLPAGESEIDSIIREAIEARGTVGLLSFGALLWSGSRVFGALTRALNIAYDADERYGFVKRTLVEFLMMLTVGLLFVVALSVRPLLTLLASLVDNFTSITESLAARAALLLVAALFLLYRFVPRVRVDWRAALLGAVLAAALIIVARPIFITYVRQFASYNLIYGSMAIVAILIFWAWIVAVIIIYGGEIVSHTQAMLIENLPGHKVEEEHLARSPLKKGRPEEWRKAPQEN
jgi:membrane protein